MKGDQNHGQILSEELLSIKIEEIAGIACLSRCTNLLFEEQRMWSKID